MHDLVAEQALVDASGVEIANELAAEFEEVFAAGADAVAALAEMAPGPELAAELARVGEMVMDTATRVRLYAQWERLSSWIEAQKMRTLCDAVGQPDEQSDRWVIADVALTTKLSERSISNRVGQMRHVALCLPQSWEALNAGRITPTHVWVLGNVTQNMPVEHATAVEARVLEKAIAKGWTPSKLRDEARRAVLKVDPQGAAERAAKAKKRRTDVRLFPDEDMMATLSASADGWTCRQMMDEINRRADELRRAGDEREIGELRVAALAEAMLGTEGEASESPAESGAPGAAAGRRTQPKRALALVLMPLGTMLGGSEPGHLDGYGPITAEMARQIAASDVNFRRLVFDPLSGRPVDLGEKSYVLSPQMRRWIEARDRTCLFPGCQTRAAFCDADHAVEWPAGETTCANCGLLCRKHHNFKTSKAWKLERNDDDSVDWTSPHGLKWHRPASSYDEFAEEFREAVDEPDAPPDPGAALWREAVDDPDPPDPDEPLPSPPPPQCDDDIDHDELGRLWWKVAQAS